MSALTAKLLKKTNSSRESRTWKRKFLCICGELEKIYGVPALGNIKNPAWEVFYILLSAKTAEVQYQRTFRALKKRFPKLKDLASASAKSVCHCIEDGGFGPRRAKRIQQIARRFLSELGSQPSRRLKKMTAEECYHYLNSLPGIGPKSALCVMMYSLDFDVFPVDVNVHRVAVRLGALKPGISTRRAQKLMPALVPDGICKKLHVTMLVHGRTVCVHKKPMCNECIIKGMCRVGRQKGRRTRLRRVDSR